MAAPFTAVFTVAFTVVFAVAAVSPAVVTVVAAVIAVAAVVAAAVDAERGFFGDLDWRRVRFFRQELDGSGYEGGRVVVGQEFFGIFFVRPEIAFFCRRDQAADGCLLGAFKASEKVGALRRVMRRLMSRSMVRKCSISRGMTKVVASPLWPARPVRPTRWT